MSETLNLVPYGDRMVVVFDDFVDTLVFKDKEGKEFAMKAPETHSERTRAATIMAVGDDPEMRQHFAVGDRIFLSWHAGTRLHLLDKIIYGRTWPEDLLRVVRSEEVLVKLERVDGSNQSDRCEGPTSGPVSEPV